MFPMDIEAIPAQDLLTWAWRESEGSFAIVTSFQAEGMVLVDMASRVCPEAHIVTVDTGRLPEETHQMMDQVRDRYGMRVEVVAPDPLEVAAMVERYGTNLFYREAPLRMLCCQLRKVRPLERKLSQFRVWATGLRRGQGEARGAVEVASAADGRLKLCPLANWSADEVARYTKDHGVPRHPLYERGYTSIGCAPCTRPVAAGEVERAGRWWWEQGIGKECGIHFSADGRLQRKVDVLLEDLLAAAAA
jgi:phosphoadenosine phosphosulfate reductase